jgi:hypothetical protein
MSEQNELITYTRLSLRYEDEISAPQAYRSHNGSSTRPEILADQQVPCKR